jgi:hypothetical protein
MLQTFPALQFAAPDKFAITFVGDNLVGNLWKINAEY